MSKDELLTLTPEWLKQTMQETSKEANAYFFPAN